MAGDPYEFMRWAGWKSEEVAETFTGDPDQIQELVDKQELVLAVWKDDQYPEANGYDVLIIKGRPRFHRWALRYVRVLDGNSLHWSQPGRSHSTVRPDWRSNGFRGR